MDVIVNADDFGMNHNVNLAIDYCFKKKYYFIYNNNG